MSRQTISPLARRHWTNHRPPSAPQRFLRDLRVLKTYANYSTCDPHNMADWLAAVDPRFRQYTYGLVQSGVDRSNVQAVTDQQLLHDCRVDNGVHRAKILSFSQRPAKPSLTDSQPAGPDVFISYRRTTGSQLARSEPSEQNRRSLHSYSVYFADSWPSVHPQPPQSAPAGSRLQRLHRRGEAGGGKIRGQVDPERPEGSQLHPGAVGKRTGQVHG